jgi:hypothetical protein
MSPKVDGFRLGRRRPLQYLKSFRHGSSVAVGPHARASPRTSPHALCNLLRKDILRGEVRGSQTELRRTSAGVELNV